MMPIRKFRDPTEMEDALWHDRGDPALARAIQNVWEFAERTVGLRFPPGLYRHRSIEEANAQRERWEEQNFEAFQRRHRSR